MSLFSAQSKYKNRIAALNGNAPTGSPAFPARGGVRMPAQGRVWFDAVGDTVGDAEGGGGSHPAFAAHVKLDGMVEVLRMLHEGDPTRRWKR